MLRVHRFLSETTVEGPGRRACVWVQGCSIRCRKCFNPGTWATSGGRVMSVAELADRILSINDIEGATFMGGEPFDQAEALAAVGSLLRDAGLSVMTFSGYEYERLTREPRAGWRDLLAVTDLLVDGPYLSAHPDRERPWVGSTNQRFHFLTPRYRHIAGELRAVPDRLEVRLRPDGSVLVNGMAPATLLNDLAEVVGKRRSGGSI